MAQPKIEIRNVKYAAFQSQDSHCFQATVYKDGKRWCVASDDGNGGCINFTPLPKSNQTGKELYKEINAFDEGAESVTTTNGGNGGFSYLRTLDIVVGDRVNDWLTEKETKRILKKLTIQDVDGKLYSFKQPYSEAFAEQVEKQYPKAKILNAMPFKDAVAIVRSL